MVELRDLPPAEAIDFFRKKGYETSFDYREMMGELHAYKFTVAKAMKRDVLQDIRAAVDDAIANGQTLDQFRKNLKPTLQQKGWWGYQTMTDPLTGQEKEVRLGTSRRLKTIFETNMRTAYAAGRWEAVQRTKAVMPYLRYVCVMDGRERPEHRAWHNVIKHVDDPFWDEHYPPCGWGCRCTVQQLSEADVKRLGLEITTWDPSGPPRNYVNQRTGEIMKVPQGITPGFNYNAGRARMKALTPPPLDEPLSVRYEGPPAAVPMPPPRPSSAAMLPSGLTEPEYAQQFLKEFGADLGKPKSFRDVSGEDIVISEDLFKTGNTWKADKNGRGPYMPLLAAALKQPDEIWELWEEFRDGSKKLRRRYLARINVEGKEKQAIVSYETGADGWTGATVFQSNDKSYLQKQRMGALVYRRAEEEK